MSTPLSRYLPGSVISMLSVSIVVFSVASVSELHRTPRLVNCPERLSKSPTC
ncbi:MAG: hypothetical protein P1V81_05280 [Planctomycetota bacterium]|nr:hypothetical protein [Planctomycetota bacterium]